MSDMKDNIRSVFTLALAALLVVSSAYGVAAVSPTVDSETTNSSSTSDLVGGETLTDLDNSSMEQHVEAVFDSENPAIEIRSSTDSDVVYHRYDGGDLTQTYADANNSTYNYEVNLTHSSAFGDVPIDANENKTVDVVFINNTEAETPDETVISVTLANDGDRTVARLDDATIASRNAETFTSYFGGFESLDFLGEEADASFEDSIEVPDDNSSHTYTVHMVNEDAIDAFDHDVDGLDAAAWIVGNSVTLTDEDGEMHAVKVYSDEAPEDIEDDIYAVYDDSANTLDVVFDEDTSGTYDVDVSTTPFGVKFMQEQFGILSGEWLDVLLA